MKNLPGKIKGEHVFSGTVEKDGRQSILLDLDERDLKKVAGNKGATYLCGKEKRFLLLLPSKFDDYKKFIDECSKKVREIKKTRKSGTEKSFYRFSNGEEIRISAKKAVVSNFLEDEKFNELISLASLKIGPTKNVSKSVSEKQIRMFFKRKKGEIFNDLSTIRKGLYSHDKEWSGFLEKNGLSICAIVPTYNESNFERNIQLTHKVKKNGLIREIVVTDGYSKRHEPSEILKSLRERGIDIDFSIIHQNGAGKGDAIESAVKYAHAQGHDFCIILDSDNMPALSRVFPGSPVDIDIEFFLRNFIGSIIDEVKTQGTEKAKKVLFKASYMRMPQLKKSFELRFGLVTRIIKDFYKRALNSSHNLYPLSGEVAFNPRFLLEKLSLNGDVLEIMGLSKRQFSGCNVPSGFCLETFWNCLIDIMGYNIRYVNTYLHHHGPVIKSTKTDIGEQTGEVLTGTFAAILTALVYKGDNRKIILKLLRKVPLEVLRSRRLALNLKNEMISYKDLV